MNTPSEHLKEVYRFSIPKMVVTFLVLLLLTTVVCIDLPVDPNNPQNSSINLLLISSDGKKYEENAYNTLGDTITIRVVMRYPQYIKGVQIDGIDTNGDTVFTQTLFSTSLETDDTVSTKHVLTNVAIKKIVATSLIEDGTYRTDEVECVVVPGVSSNGIPEFTLATSPQKTVFAGDNCTLFVAFKNPSATQNVVTTVQRNGVVIAGTANTYIWNVPADAQGYDTLIVTATDSTNPTLTATNLAVVAIEHAIPEAVAAVNIVSKDAENITLSWEGSSRAQFYRLYVADSAGGTYTLYKDSLKTTTFVDALQPTTKYYVVSAVNSAGSSNPSVAISSVDRINNAPGWKITDTLHVDLVAGASFTLALADTCSDLDGDLIAFTLLPDLLDVDNIEGTTYTCTPVAAGTFVAAIIAQDPPGLSDTLFIKFTVTEPVVVDPTSGDSTGPAIELKTPDTDGKKVGSPSITVEVVCTDISGVGSVTCLFGGSDLPVAKGTQNVYTVDVGALADGANALVFTATDESVNSNKTVKTVTIVYDRTMADLEGPVITLQSPEAGSKVSTAATTVVVECTDISGVASVTCSFGDKTLLVTNGAANTYTVDVTELAAGENMLAFTAVDNSSNSNKSSKSIRIVYDQTMNDKEKPIVTLQSPKTDKSSVSASSVTVEVTCTDISGIADVTCSFGATTIAVTKGGSNSYAAIVAGLVPGENSITFTATDASSNANKATFLVTVIHDPSLEDNVAPAMKLITPATSGVRLLDDFITVEIECTDENGVASVSCVRGSENVPVTNSGSIYSAVITKLAPGVTEKITFTATDKSTNENKRTLDVEVQYNTPIGAITLGEPESDATGIASTPTFTWSGGSDPDGDAVFFKVQYGTSPTSLTVQTSEKTASPAVLSSGNALEPFTKYYWQVIAYSKTNEDTQKSEVRSFTTKGIAPEVDDSKLKDISLKTDDLLTLSVTATGTPVPTYQWYHNDKPIDCTDATYQKTAIAATDAGTYHVMVSNAVKSNVKSKVITVSVVTPPLITKDPLPLEVRLGEKATFTVAASGSDLSYQWQKGQKNLTENAREDTYTIDITTTDDDRDKFRCVVWNSVDTVESKEVQLTLLYSVTYDAKGGSGAPTHANTYSRDKLVTLSTVEPSRANYDFLGWSTDKNAIAKEYDPGDSYTMGKGDVTFYAVWSAKKYTLTISADNGNVTKKPSKDTYTAGEVVELSATANDGWQFDSWGGDASGSTKTISITMNENKSVAANFLKIPVYTLTTKSIGSGSVTLHPAGGSYLKGSTVTLTAVAAEGWEFKSWSSGSSTTNPLSIIMNGTMTVTATFGEKEITVVKGGVTYHGVKIGDQIWMKENYRYDGASDYKERPGDWAAAGDAAKPAHCHPNGDVNNSYGLLYNGHVLFTSGFVPAGWRVPTKEDFQILINTLNGKDAGDPAGFAAVMAGWREGSDLDGADEQGAFWRVGEMGEYWTTEHLSVIYNDDPDLYFNSWEQPGSVGLSVRLIKIP